MGYFDDLFDNPVQTSSGGGFFTDLFDDSPGVFETHTGPVGMPADALDTTPSFFGDLFEGVGESLSVDPNQVVDSLGAGLTQIPLGLIDGVDMLSRLPVSPRAWVRAVDPELDAPIEDLIESARQPLAERVERLRPEDDGRSFFEAPVQQTLNAVAEGAPMLAGMLATGPAAGLGLAATMEGGAAYREAKDRGVGEGVALTKGVGVGVASAFLERLGIDAMLGKLPGLRPKDQRKLLENVAVAFAGEGATEAAQETVNIGSEVLTGRQIDGAEIRERLLTATAAGGVTGSLVGGAVGARNTATGQRLEPKLQNLLDRELTTRGGLPEYMFQAKERADQEIAASTVEMGHVADDFRRARMDYLKANPDVSPATLDEQAHLYLTGDHTHAPEALRPHLDRMRTMVDDRSTALIDAPGLLNDAQRATIAENRGSYLRRSFRVHDDPEWIDKVRGTDAWHQAEAHIREQNPEFNDAEVEDRMLDLATQEPDAFFVSGGSGLGTKDATSLRHRKEIEEPILRLMGEYRDPAVSFVKTMERTTRMLARHQMYSAIYSQGQGTDFHALRQEGYTTQIPGSAGPAGPYGPIGGLFTSPEIRQAMDHSLEQHGTGALSMVNGMVKWGLTVGSVQAQARNMESNFLALMAGGHFFMPSFHELPGAGLARIAKGAKTASHGLSLLGMRDDDMRQVYTQALRHGVVGGNVDLGDVDYYLRDLSERMGQTKAGSALRKPFSTLQSAYQFGDDTFKLAAFWSEQKRLRWALGDSVNAAEIDARAAENVKATMQNYQRLPKAVQRIRRLPFIGPFVSFPVAVAVNVKNQLRLGLQDLQDSNPRMRYLGAHRLGGLAMAMAAPAMIAKSVQALRGVEWSGEEDEDLREFLPHYMENSELTITSKTPGKVTVIDNTFMDYFGAVKKPVLASIRAGQVDESAFSAAMGAMLEPILGEEIFFGSLVDVARNLDHYGNEVYPETANEVTKIQLTLGHLWDQNKPGTLKTLERIRTRDAQVEALAAAGPRVHTVDIPRELERRARGHVKVQGDAARRVSSVLTSARKVDPGDMRLELRAAREAVHNSYAGMQRAYGAAQRLGVNPAELQTRLRSARLINRDRKGFHTLDADQLTDLWMRDRLVAVNKTRQTRMAAELRAWVQAHPMATPSQVQRQRERLRGRWAMIRLEELL